jgi:outer membrane protein OmpA-like peptidoglycan-associated protein
MLLMIALLAFPSTFGSKGIYRAKCADVEWLMEARSILTIHVDGEGYRYDYTDTSYDYGSARVGIGYTPVNWFEAYTLWRAHGEGTVRLPLSESDSEGDIGDIDIGGKAVLKKIRNSYLGADLSITLPVGADEYSNNGIILYPKLLGTVDFSDYMRLFPVRMHLNAGIPIGREGLGDHFPITGACAFELPSKLFTYFIELSRNHERDWHWRVSPGLKFHPFHRISLTVAADLGIVEDYRLLGASAGISLNSSLIRERETRPTGNLAGEIRDATTKMPLKGHIKLMEIDEEVVSNEEFGAYKIIGIPQGIYTLRVEAPYYAAQTRVIIVEKNKTELLNFMLTRAKLTYEGIVLDMNTRQPVSDALVMIDGETKITTATDEVGMFEEILTPGPYVVKVSKTNYVQYVTEQVFSETRHDTIMLKSIEAIAETPEAIVYFDLDDANVRADQRPTLDSIAEFLKSHPTVRCELRGHTDPSGDITYNEILSLARANSVKDYFVKVHGIEKQRISTLAFSKTKLIKESPEKSRRVEIFLIK